MKAKRKGQKATTDARRPAVPRPRRGVARAIDAVPAASGAAGALGASGAVGTADAIADGACWLGPDQDHEFGPFESCDAAQAASERCSEEAPGEGTTPQEAERENGGAGWIDAETGDPAADRSPPRFEEP